MNKLIALVKFNNEIALVLQDKIQKRYNRYDDLLIGIDDTGTFIDCLYYETPIGRFEAFGGREFDIPLENGGIIHCSGQWWSGGSRKAEKILNKKLCKVVYNDIESLRECYVYSGDCAIEESLQELLATYNGKIYEYSEFNRELKDNKI